MSIRLKTLLIIGFTLTSLILGLFAFTQIFLLQSYVELEQQTLERNVQRAVNALSDELAVMHNTNIDWAHWNDTYQFVEDQNQAYTDANTYDGTFTNYGLNVMVFWNEAGDVVFGKAYDLGENQVVDVPVEFLDQESRARLFDFDNLPVDGIQGIVMLSTGPMLVAATPILPTDLNGPARGVLLWGSYLNDWLVTELSEQTRLTMTVHTLADPDMSEEMAEVVPTLADSDIAMHAPDETLIMGYRLINDVHGEPVLALQVDMPRSIYQQGRTTLSYFLVSLLALGLVSAIATLLLLERVVLSRLAALSDSVSNIQAHADISERVNIRGTDELASLALAINGMLDSLASAQDKLKQARDAALEASHTKAQILANVSHDARTPLSVIILRTDMLLKRLYGPLTERQEKMLHGIKDSSNQLLGFITNLLDASQVESGKIQFSREEFQPGILLATLEESLKPLAVRKGLTLTTTLADDMPPVLYGDEQRLYQVTSNLINNAIKFTNQGSIRVRVYRHDRDHWAIQVRDTGIGIPDYAKDRIFESFWQVDGSSTRMATSGVGLGLAIVKQFVELMGGSILMESAVGVGTTFTVVLPVDTAAEEQAGDQFAHTHH